jgi:hypothetical protein
LEEEDLNMKPLMNDILYVGFSPPSKVKRKVESCVKELIKQAPRNADLMAYAVPTRGDHFEFFLTLNFDIDSLAAHSSGSDLTKIVKKSCNKLARELDHWKSHLLDDKESDTS